MNKTHQDYQSSCVLDKSLKMLEIRNKNLGSLKVLEKSLNFNVQCLRIMLSSV